jgi:hypothetical protein
MAIMGKYCKAYPVNQLREFIHWTEYSQNTRKENQNNNNPGNEVNRELADKDFLYLQEN